MKKYKPHTWVLLKFTQNNELPVYKILAGWYGNFEQDDSWRLCSGVNGVKFINNVYHVYNYSGSIYECHVDNEKLSGLTSAVLSGWQKSNDIKVEQILMRDYI